MEFKYNADDALKVVFTPTVPESVLLREAIRKQLVSAATGISVLKHEVAVTLVHYLTESKDSESGAQSVQCSQKHLAVFIDTLGSAMRDFSVDDTMVAAQMIEQMKEASIEDEVMSAGMTLPDYVPDSL